MPTLLNQSFTFNQQNHRCSKIILKQGNKDADFTHWIDEGPEGIWAVWPECEGEHGWKTPTVTGKVMAYPCRKIGKSDT